MPTLPYKRLLTAAEFAALPRTGLRTELIGGTIAAQPPAFGDHGEIAIHLGVILGHYVLAHTLGEVYAAGTGFLIERDPDTVRAPDFAFIRKERVPAPSGKPGWVSVMPDLVAEVVSSGDRVAEIGEKVAMWLRVGVRLVLVAWPQRREIEVYRPDMPLATLREDDMLDGYDVLPGFSAAVARVYR
ncbi:MAG: hypothetical protein OJF49_002460 [Ktedonobacterales bacterium]|nr:MAG: hypothetical protein OJF49_002460 [Ktedonobacterales bacterium]